MVCSGGLFSSFKREDRFLRQNYCQSLNYLNVLIFPINITLNIGFFLFVLEQKEILTPDMDAGKLTLCFFYWWFTGSTVHLNIMCMYIGIDR
jgi:hypothetical protein